MEEVEYNKVIEQINSLNNKGTYEIIDVNKAFVEKSEANFSNYEYEKAIQQIDKILSVPESKNLDIQTAKKYQEPSMIKTFVKDAEKELEGAMTDIGKNIINDIQDISVPSIKKNKLVLINLSTEDQIDELEKISIGIDEKVFDKKHLEIIKEECDGLSEFVSAAAKKHISEAGDATIRNQRLDEVLKKIDIAIKEQG